MKNMPKKSSFFNTFSAGLILSCLGTNVFKCEASLQEEAREEVGNGKQAAAASFAEIDEDDKELVEDVPVAFTDPLLKGERERLQEEANKSYATIGKALKKYQETEGAAWAAVVALRKYLFDLSGANYNLLVFYGLHLRRIEKLTSENREAKKRVSQLEAENKSLIEEKRTRENKTALFVQESSAEIDKLRLENQQAQKRIAELEAENKELRDSQKLAGQGSVSSTQDLVPARKPWFLVRFFMWCGIMKRSDETVNERTKLI